MMSVRGCVAGNRGNAVVREGELDKVFAVSFLGFLEASEKTSKLLSPTLVQYR